MERRSASASVAVDTITRRPESYHRKVLRGANAGNGSAASIHDRVVFKQPDLDKRLQYDDHLRKSLIDLFYDNDGDGAHAQVLIATLTGNPTLANTDIQVI